MPEKEFTLTDSLVINKNHPSLAGHFPDNPIVPGVVILDHVIRLWQEKSSLSVSQINNTKFINLLRADIVCTIRYTEKPKQKINFLLTNTTKKQQTEPEVICKGQFSYCSEL